MRVFYEQVTGVKWSAWQYISVHDAEITQLQQARALIAGAVVREPKLKSALQAPTRIPKAKRMMSPEGRAHIEAAQKARWAAAKKKAAK
jgi:hypothetical protein